MRLQWHTAGERMPAAGEVVLLYRAAARRPVLAVMQYGDPEARGEAYARDRWHVASPYPGEAPWQWVEPGDRWARVPAPERAAKVRAAPEAQPTLWGPAA